MTGQRPGPDQREGTASAPLLDVRNLRTHFFLREGTLRAVDGVTFSIAQGETVGLVGESGSGKSVTALSLLRLLPSGVTVRVAGRALFEGADLLRCSDREIQRIRGRHIGMVFQDPTTSLNPVLTIGLQMAEGLRTHLRLRAAEIRERSIGLLHQVGISEPEDRLSAYPHEFSGGMRQRVMIAMALSCDPKLLLADEPTTALDVTIQAQILELLATMAARMGVAMLLITHNLGIVAGYTRRTLVMYAGKIVEEALTVDLFSRPRHPYTMRLLESVPRLDRPRVDRLSPIEGTPPNPLHVLRGCSYAPRCPFALEKCRKDDPPLERLESGGHVACWVKP